MESDCARLRRDYSGHSLWRIPVDYVPLKAQCDANGGGCHSEGPTPNGREFDEISLLPFLNQKSIFN